jgi:hypothetical protein
MTPIHLSTKLLQALTSAAAFAALSATTTALAGTPAREHATPDSFERYAAVHPYGTGVASVKATPDAFERYAVIHAPAALTDRMSPDTHDLAEARQLALDDRRSPDTADTATSGRTAIAAPAIAPTDIRQRGNFDWGDAGIGATAAVLILGLMGGLMLLFPMRPRRRAQTT